MHYVPTLIGAFFSKRNWEVASCLTWERYRIQNVDLDTTLVSDPLCSLLHNRVRVQRLSSNGTLEKRVSPRWGNTLHGVFFLILSLACTSNSSPAQKKTWVRFWDSCFGVEKVSDGVCLLSCSRHSNRKQRVVAAPSPEVRRHRTMHINVKKNGKNALTSEPWRIVNLSNRPINK